MDRIKLIVEDGSGNKKMREDIDLGNLDRKEIKKIKRLADLNKLNIYYDKNSIISKLCSELLKRLEKRK